jgi:4-hydroxy-2-oxoglutarate aldolase
MKLQGIFPPIATPFDHNGEIWKTKVEHNVGKWNRTALAGYVVCGSTGESICLTTPEKVQLWEWVAQYAAPEKLLIAGTGVESVHETVELTNRAAELGYKAAMVRTPHYFKNLLNNDAAQLTYFRSVADRVKIPVMIYNWPQTTGIDISVEAACLLSEHPNIIAIKESSGNLEKILRLVNETRKGFQVLTGSAPMLAPSLAAGCTGAVLAFSNAAPYACITIWEAFRTREMDAANDWQRRIMKAARLVTVKYGVPGLKHAMDFNGFYGGPPRLPLAPVGPDARREIEEAFDGLRG